MRDAANKPPLVETCLVQDVFCSELARLEIVGTWARLSFAVRKRDMMTGKEERIVVAQIVMPKEAAAALGHMAPFEEGKLDDELPEGMPPRMQ